MSISIVFRKRTLAWVGFIALTSIIWRGPALADRSKIAPDLLPAIDRPATFGAYAVKAKGTQRVIVQTATRSDSAVLGSVATLGGKVKKSYQNIGGFAAELPAAQILKLSDNPSVTRISPDRPVAACSDSGIEAVGGDSASINSVSWADGTGLAIAVIDSGLANHTDIPYGQVDGWKDFVNGKPYQYDDCGHGTHVAGILVGSGRSSTGLNYTKTFRGIAPKAKLVVAKVLGADGTGYTSDVIAAIDWIIANASAKHIRVINMSLGHPVTESYKTDPLCQAVERAVAANIVVVCSAGNAGPQYGTISSPGNDPAVITVGATRTLDTESRSDDMIFYYSSRGPSRIDYVAKPDIVAPGNDIVSLRAKGSFLDSNYPENRVPTSEYSILPMGQDSQYYVMSGTSVAAPMVAAAATLILQKSPRLTPNAVKAILMYSASNMKGVDVQGDTTTYKQYDALTVGSGYLNIPGALAVAKNVDTGKAVGQYWSRGPMACWNWIGSDFVSWSRDIQWANCAVSGDLFAFNEANWGSILWGSSNSWTGNVAYGADQVDLLSPIWQSLWAADPEENSDAQTKGDNAIWGGRPML